MSAGRKKVKSNLEVAKSGNRLLRLLGLDAGFQAPILCLEKTEEKSVYNDGWREVRNAIIEAEYRKAKAIMAMQQHRNFY